MKEKQKRVKKANKLIEVIGSCGCNFFNAPSKYGLSKFEVDHRGRIWFVDGYSGKRIYLHYRYWKRGFTQGGTIRDLVNALKEYIATGNPINAYHFGPWSQQLCNGDLWGYGQDMQQVRDCAFSLGIIDKNLT